MRFLSTKTEHRRKWEEGLPERDKVLRLQIQVLKAGIKRDKKAMKYALDEGVTAFLKRSVNAQNVVIRAIKHELQRVEVSIPTYKLNRTVPLCNFCGKYIEEGDIGTETDETCPCCGHRINWGGSST